MNYSGFYNFMNTFSDSLASNHGIELNNSKWSYTLSVSPPPPPPINKINRKGNLVGHNWGSIVGNA